MQYIDDLCGQSQRYRRKEMHHYCHMLRSPKEAYIICATNQGHRKKQTELYDHVNRITKADIIGHRSRLVFDLIAW